MKHNKHSKLEKPDTGLFGRNEISFTGTNCTVIEEVMSKIALEFGPQTLIIDASHKELTEPINEQSITFLGDSHYKASLKKPSSVSQKINCSEAETILINGNHYAGLKQVVFLDSKKEESLKRRISQLTAVIAYIVIDLNEPYGWLEANKETPVLKLNEIDRLTEIIKNSRNKAPLNALILAGGKSLRMGVDKALMSYHKKTQIEHLTSIFKDLGISSFVSRNTNDIEGVEIIPDTFIDLGPYGGILSAFRKNPKAAWLVVACDLPLILKGEIEELISARNPLKVATACYNPETEFPDPLFTIWEPKAYTYLLNYLSQGYSCPRKVLINEDIELLKLKDPKILINANTPKEKEEILNLIDQSLSS